MCAEYKTLDAALYVSSLVIYEQTGGLPCDHSSRLQAIEKLSNRICQEDIYSLNRVVHIQKTKWDSDQLKHKTVLQSTKRKDAFYVFIVSPLDYSSF